MILQPCSLDNSEQVDAILLYRPYKAFDKVSHIRLCHKLASYGIRGNTLMLKWIQSFLSERFQGVVLNGKQSD